MKALIYPNLTRERAFGITLNILAYLKSAGIGCLMLDDMSAPFADHCSDFIPADQLTGSADVLIAVGGDGTMLRASRLAYTADIPVIGVNAGRLAYLMSLDEGETGLLKLLGSDSCSVTERIVLEVDVRDSDGNGIFSDICVNDGPGRLLRRQAYKPLRGGRTDRLLSDGFHSLQSCRRRSDRGPGRVGYHSHSDLPAFSYGAADHF